MLTGRQGAVDLSSIALAKWLLESLIDTLRRECLDQMLIFGEAH